MGLLARRRRRPLSPVLPVRRPGPSGRTADDLWSWERVGDVVAASEAPAFDDLATWTGSVARDRDGRWWLFYTGVTVVDGKFLQTIGAATSADLESWHKDPASPLVTADDRWYE